ncbi:uncharacterized protein LOC117646646 isoform X2 [Thrips palmi]|uniref:Uncharacterized protein LOC117646646 isoform X2 n=1 Tax=Thrips palmi TaxID=161013 RepID=A0A6P8Z102_THRPL|nr:uncharacterized protein LOC117646646 isoform X2 [Thrips palmi]
MTQPNPPSPQNNLDRNGLDTATPNLLLDHPGMDQNGSVTTDCAPTTIEAELSNLQQASMDYLGSMEQLQIQTSDTTTKQPAELIPEEDKVPQENSLEAQFSDSGKTPDPKDVLMEGVEIPPNIDEVTSVLLCRLCSLPCQEAAPVFLFRHPPHHPEVLPKEAPINQEEEELGDILSMIKATLPIKVSCCDKLPKQVCTKCVERLRLSHAFTATVLRAESQLNSLRAHQKTDKADSNDMRNPFSPQAPYDCPICKESPVLSIQSSSHLDFHSGRYDWENVIVKNEPEDPIEPSAEDLERSYNEFFGGQKDFETFRTEERITLKPSKPACFGGRRPRGRPRSRPFKLTPRGRRGRRSTQTTVERILELSQTSPDADGYGFRICSRENNPASEALTQCLLCDKWLLGIAACLQHSLAEHMDCGSFLCPRCPRDDFPGDFELIQHYQESHCPDLELYEVFQSERSNTPNITLNNVQSEMELAPDCNMIEANVGKKEGKGTPLESSWHVEPMEFDNLNNLHNTPPNDLYESQDEVSSNLSELAPRSLTSHSAMYEEESNSISTHGSDSNLAHEDILTSHIPDQHTLQDELMGQSSNLADEVSFSNSPCTLGVGDFVDLRSIEEESQDNKSVNKTDFCSVQDSTAVGEVNIGQQGNDFKSLQEDCQESQDSLRADELCGFQEAINEKSQEVSLNGSAIDFNP